MDGYYIVPVGTIYPSGTTGTTVLQTGTIQYPWVLYSTHGYYEVPKTGYYGYYKPKHAAQGMSRVRVRVRR